MNKPKFLKALVAVGVVAVCSFGLFACQNGSSASGGTAATVNGTAIPEEKVTNTIQTVRSQSGLESEDEWGQFLASNDMTPESVREQIIDSLVNQELVKQGAADLGVKVESSEIDTYVESMKANFDSDDAWKQALSEAGFTEDSYRQSIEESLLSQNVGKYFEEKAEPTDADAIESAKTYGVYYDGAKRSSHILFKVENKSDEAAMTAAREKAQAVLDQINGGLDFAEAAKQNSEDTSAANGGDVGWDRVSTFVPEYQTALDGLEVGQVSGLVETEYGIHIIKCTEVFKAPEEITSLDQLPAEFRETITSMSKSVKANNDYNTWLEGLREKADIKINPMPSNVPYNVDMSKYATASSEAASSDEASASSETAASGSAAASDASASGEAAASGSAAASDASASSAAASSDAAASSESASSASSES